MTPAQIVDELGQLDALIARLGTPRDYGEALQLQQAKRRAEMLQAALGRLNEHLKAN